MTSVGAPFSILFSGEPSTDARARLARITGLVGFTLLLLAVGTLLIRPADLLPFLGDLPIYESLVAACILFSLPVLIRQLKPCSLKANAISAMVLLLIPAGMLSHLVHCNTYDARQAGIEIAKACLLFLLIVGTVNSTRRLRILLLIVAVCVFIQASLAVMQYRGLLHLSALQSIEQSSMDPGSEESTITRICGIGVFNDPNDFSLILVTAMVVCAYGLGERRLGQARLLLLMPFVILAYALLLTHSRGGFMSAIIALLAFLPGRFGWRNTLPLACIILAFMLFTFSGRQTQVDVDNPEDTFQTRLGLWSDSLDQFRSAPIFGIGQNKLLDEIGQVCHNSYLHAYTEMGLIGGTAFAGAFYLTINSIKSTETIDPDLSRLRPYILALVAGYAAGLLSLSRCYTVPTQLILALGAACVVTAGRSVPRLDFSCIRRVFAVGLLLLGFIYLFMRVMIADRGML